MKKVLLGIIIFFVLLIGTAIALPFIFKDKINAKVKEEINKSLNAKVDYGDFDISILRSFPNFSFALQNLSVVGINEFKGDTLAYIKSLDITLDIMTVIKGEKYKILRLGLTEPKVNALVNFDGKANWDIVKSTGESKSTEPTNFSLEIKKYFIENGNIVYDDKKGNMYASVENLDFEGSGDVTQDIYDLVTKTKIEALTVTSGGIPYLSKVAVDAKMDLSIDNKASKYTFKENEINLNALGLKFDGFIQTVGETINLDVKFAAKQAEFKSILSMIPAVYQKDFDKIKTSGTLKLSGFAKGKYEGENYPALALNLLVENASFQYPSLPVAVNKIFIKANIAKPQGKLDALVIDVPQINATLGTDAIFARLNVKTPITDPNVKANIAGTLNLGNVPKFYPLEGVKSIAGILNIKLDINARMSDVNNKRYESINAAGNAKVAGLVYDSKETPMAVRIPIMELTFNPRNVTLNSLSAVLGRSDFQATGTLDNFLPYFFNKGDLVGTLNLKSKQFDTNEWLTSNSNGPSKESKPATATAEGKTEYFKVPAHIDFTAKSEFGKILYDKLVLENVKGNVLVKNEAIILDPIFAELLGGNATITAKYNTFQKTTPEVTFTYDINSFDFQKTVQFAGFGEKVAPVMKYLQGSFSSDMKGEGKLNADMSLDYQSLTGNGKVEIPSARIVNMPILQKIAEVTKISALKNPELNKAMTVLKFKDGRVAVEPTNIKLGSYNIAVDGTNGFDQTIDYNIRFDVPQSELGGAVSSVQNLIPKIPGVPFEMPSVISFFLKATGTASKPSIKLNKVGAGTGGTSVKDLAKQKLEEEKAKLEAEARKKAEELKQQATQELDKQKKAAEEKVKAEADRIKKDAEAKAKAAADKAKKDAENKLRGIFKR
jgi:hypothetical protein